ncbi:MAG: glutaredoxin domain-containing protein [Poseidonia sp.]
MVQHDDVEVVIWTGRGCGACVQAKQFLGRKKVAFKERRLKSDAATQRAFAKATRGARTVPQIFVGQHHVGGFDDLLQVEKTGELDVLLGRAATLPQRSAMQRFLRWLGF